MSRSISSLSPLLARLRDLAALPLARASAMDPGFYRSEALLELERERIFRRQWICIGLSAALEKPGDFLCDEVAGQPLVLIRQGDGAIAAFANVCRHRMMTLLEGQGNCRRIVCPYHAWTYGADGRLIRAPHMDRSEDFSLDRYSLAGIRCEEWQGWIYVTLDASLPPVSRMLARLEPMLAPYAMADYVPIDRQTHTWQTNWKQLTENFMEGYHLPVAHRATVGAWFPVEETRFGPGEADPAFTYQWFTKSADARVGVAHADNVRLEGEQRRTSILPTVFPSHMFSLAPDHVWYLSLEPVSVGEVKVRYGAAMAPEVLAASTDVEMLKQETRAFLERVNEEDRRVVEGIWRGAGAPLSSAGPLCWLERENHEFTRYLARQLVDD